MSASSGAARASQKMAVRRQAENGPLKVSDNDTLRCLGVRQNPFMRQESQAAALTSSSAPSLGQGSGSAASRTERDPKSPGSKLDRNSAAAFSPVDLKSPAANAQFIRRHCQPSPKRRYRSPQRAVASADTKSHSPESTTSAAVEQPSAVIAPAARLEEQHRNVREAAVKAVAKVSQPGMAAMSVGYRMPSPVPAPYSPGRHHGRLVSPQRRLSPGNQRPLSTPDSATSTMLSGRVVTPHGRLSPTRDRSSKTTVKGSSLASLAINESCGDVSKPSASSASAAVVGDITKKAAEDALLVLSGLLTNPPPPEWLSEAWSMHNGKMDTIRQNGSLSTSSPTRVVR